MGSRGLTVRLGKWSLLAAFALALRADTLTLASASNYVSNGAGNALTTTADPRKAVTFERLYAGNGFFYLRWNGALYVATDPSTGALALTAPNTVTAEQFQTAASGAGMNIKAR